MTTKFSYSCLFVMYIIVLQIFFFNLVISEFSMPWDNATTNAEKANRLKRSLIDSMPIQLNIKIKYENDDEIILTWKKVNAYVANENLPVIVPLVNKDSEVMTDIGKFVAYYDIPHCSAVVFFEKLRSFYGVIGTNYYIEDLPYNFDDTGNYQVESVGTPYITKHHSHLFSTPPLDILPLIYHSSFWQNYLLQPFTFSEVETNQINSDMSVDTQEYKTTGNQNYKQSENIMFDDYFCETLVFVARDIVDLFIDRFGMSHYIERIVKHYVVYFHAVDMMFKSILSPYGFIQINIAKICIEDNSAPFSFLNNDVLQYSWVTTKLSDYFSTFSQYYPVDSFDHVFIHTSRSIWDGFVRRHGITRRSANLIHAKKNNQYYHAVPITMMGFQYSYADYITTVHALGGIFYMNMGPEDRELTTTRQCYDIMQRGGPRCDNCFQWSEFSKTQLNIFFRTNQNRCFLLNIPRSLYKPGPHRLYTPYQQCRCYGYEFYRVYPSGRLATTILVNQCAEPLSCEQHAGEVPVCKKASIPPFDGTPCGLMKVCWNKECVKQLIST